VVRKNSKIIIPKITQIRWFIKIVVLQK